MQCLQLTRGEPPAMTVNVALSGTFDSKYGYVTIDGTKYTSEQTLTVAKGTSVTVLCGSQVNLLQSGSKITLNGTTVAQGTNTAAAEYTLSVTSNCTIAFSRRTSSGAYTYSATITMPA